MTFGLQLHIPLESHDDEVDPDPLHSQPEMFYYYYGLLKKIISALPLQLGNP